MGKLGIMVNEKPDHDFAWASMPLTCRCIHHATVILFALCAIVMTVLGALCKFSAVDAPPLYCNNLDQEARTFLFVFGLVSFLASVIYVGIFWHCFLALKSSATQKATGDI